MVPTQPITFRSRLHTLTMKATLALLLATGLALLTTRATAAVVKEPRHALVVGNAAYQSAQLLNSVND